MSDLSLQPDCTRCAALCCVGLAFDRSDHFAISKPAGVPCPRLQADGLCSIHDRLAEDGFGGCVRYTCFGAGQRVTQDLFAGGSWQRDPALLEPMMRAFRALRTVHELLAMLTAADRLPLSDEARQRRQCLERVLSPSDGWSRATLAEFENSTVPEEARDFFRSLRPLAASA